MNFTDFITHSGKRVNKELFINLIQVSKIDGVIEESELRSLYKEGKKFGLTEPEIEMLISKESYHNYHAPYSLNDKFEHLYNVAVMILADDVITESENRMIRRFAIEAGFSDKAIEKLVELLFRGIKNNESEESLLEEFKKNLF